MLVVLNKADVLKRRRQSIDSQQLAAVLGCPVVSLSAHDRRSTEQFKDRLAGLMGSLSHQPLRLDYGPVLEGALAQLESRVEHPHLAARGCALRLLEADPVLRDSLAMDTDSYLNLLNCTQVEVDLDLHLADVRYGFV